jgi:hypothetical protein
MKRHFGIPAAGDQDHRGVDSSRPHTASADAGSNVIRLADYRPSPADDQPNSERLTVAPSFIREFAACAFVVFFLNIPGVLLLTGILLYAAFVAQPGEY